MPDYGQPITFGLSLYPSVDGVDEAIRLARAADAAGLEYLAIQAPPRSGLVPFDSDQQVQASGAGMRGRA